MSETRVSTRRRALILATGSYDERRISNLPVSSNDADAISATLGLKGLGKFEIFSLLDPEKQEAQSAIERIFATEAEPLDFLVLYITGHGVVSDDPPEGRKLWLALKDYSDNSPRSTALEASWIDKILAGSKASQILVIVDTCHSALFSGGKGSRGRLVRPSEAQVKDAQLNAFSTLAESRIRTPKFRFYIFACDTNEKAYIEPGPDGKQPLSRLTKLITQSLWDGTADRRGTGKVSVDDLWRAVDEGSSTWPNQRPINIINPGSKLGDAIVAWLPDRLREQNNTTSIARLENKEEWRLQFRRATKRARRRRNRRQRILSLLVVLLLLTSSAAGGVFYTQAHKAAISTTMQLDYKVWQQIDTDGTVHFSQLSGGIIQVAVPPGELQWYGLYFAKPGLCNYSLDVWAKHIGQQNPANGSGWGYGISVRSTWDSDQQLAQGQTIQDEFSEFNDETYGDVRLTILSNTNSNPYKAFDVPPDLAWHDWKIIVSGSVMEIKRDNQAIGSFPSEGCGGVFLRVWAETVQFRDITLTSFT
ncbi:MAG TPA: caspase family protein [Actinocrinis sp.]|nr:caspase family protein [Actinocrinis sp.]